MAVCPLVSIDRVGDTSDVSVKMRSSVNTAQVEPRRIARTIRAPTLTALALKSPLLRSISRLPLGSTIPRYAVAGITQRKNMYARS
jgi:hypothetical protein